MAKKPPPNKILVVEGINDAHIFWNLLDRHGFTKEVREKNRFAIEVAGSITEMQGSLASPTGKPTDRELALSLSIRVKTRTIEKLGLVADADKKSDGRSGKKGVNRWASLSGILREEGFANFPANLSETGAVLNQSGQTPSSVGVWIMPNNIDGGMIEDWAQTLRPTHEAQSRLWNRAMRVVDEIPSEERVFPEVHIAKAVIHTWLAWQKQPGKPIGQAIQAGYLDTQAEPAQKFMAWFQQVFSLDLNA